MHNRAALALQALGLRRQGADVDTLLVHQAPIAYQHGLACDFGARAAAFEVEKLGHVRDVEVRSAFDNGERQRVVRAAIDGRRSPQRVILRAAFGGNDLDHARFAHGQRAGLVEDDHVKLGRVFQRTGILEQDTVLRP